jgi:hypothetical protein
MFDERANFDTLRDGSVDAYIVSVVFSELSGGYDEQFTYMQNFAKKIESEITRTAKLIRVLTKLRRDKFGCNEFTFRFPSTNKKNRNPEDMLLNTPCMYGIIYGKFRHQAIEKGMANYFDAKLRHHLSEDIQSITIEPIIEGNWRPAHRAVVMPGGSVFERDEHMCFL